MQTDCNEGGIHVQFTQRISGGKLIAIIMKVALPEKTKLILGGPLANILGFEDTRYDNGEYESSRTPNAEAFAKVELNTEIGTITAEKYTEKMIELDQIEGTPTISALLASVVLKLRGEGLTIKLRFIKTKGTIDWEHRGIRITLSPFLKNFLNLGQTSYFENSGSVPVPKKIIEPPEIVPEPTPKKARLSCSKLIVFCNIIGSQVYCGKQKNILAVIGRHESEDTKRFVVSPTVLLYNEVTVSKISQIEIELRSDMFEFVEYSELPTVIALHFRKRAYENI